MLELICHQTYTWQGLPADKSPYRNHGTAINTGGSYDGVTPGSGVVTFTGPTSRVRIPTGQSWRPLTALKIDALVRVQPRAERAPVLVAGHASFRFGLLDGLLTASFENASGTNSLLHSGEAYAPDGRPHPVPANRWVRLGFHHDGFARMRLFIDGELVAEAPADGGVPPVGSLGVAIGNAADADGARFPGEIDEIQIWRLDPRAVKREFLDRPLTRRAARCWEEYAVAVGRWAQEHPAQARALAQRLGALNRDELRALYLLPDAEQGRMRSLLAAIGRLWGAGRIAGPEMRAALCDWVTAMHRIGRADGLIAAAHALRAEFGGRRPHLPDILACDRQLAAFLDLLRDALEQCGPDREAV